MYVFFKPPYPQPLSFQYCMLKTTCMYNECILERSCKIQLLLSYCYCLCFYKFNLQSLTVRYLRLWCLISPHPTYFIGRRSSRTLPSSTHPPLTAASSSIRPIRTSGTTLAGVRQTATSTISTTPVSGLWSTLE